MKNLVVTTALLLAASSASAQSISFADWKHQRLSLFSANSYSFGSKTLGITSDGSVSIAWTRLPEDRWNATSAAWSWSVAQSVPPTNLSRKGGDDRNISVYFVFLPKAEAQRLKGASIRALLGNKSVRVLQYAWGGNHGRGAIISSPYGPKGQGATIALRQAGTGSASENVNLARDYGRAFGGTPGKLVGLAVSGDSDDTDSQIQGKLSSLTLR